MKLRITKYFALAIGIFTCTAQVNAQVKVGDNPTSINPNSVLEIESTNKGILFPRVGLTSISDASPLAAHINGMVVFNTTENVSVQPGLYMNNGSEWIKLEGNEFISTYLVGDGAPSGACVAGSMYTDSTETSATFGEEWKCKGGAWELVTDVNTNTTPFYRWGTTKDALGNKAAVISRPNGAIFHSADKSRRTYLTNDGGIKLSRGVAYDVNGYLDFSRSHTAHEFRVALRTDVGAGKPFAQASLIFTSDQKGIIMNMERISGNIGMGVLRPEEKLHIGGNLRITGDAIKPGGGAWTAPSDIRSKENIIPFTKGIDELMKVKPVSFQYKESMEMGDKRIVGTIAQELEKVLPEMVTEKSIAGIKDFKTVDPSEFTYLLINAVKEQQHQIEEQKKQIANLTTLVHERLAQRGEKHKREIKVAKRKASKKSKLLFSGI